ncbi:cadherin-7-like isoform X2 [Scyliorhinus canicula]|uniref:cadherin-7-like isoform X2 n=1 Tax=Scyliorhinus canicula TaxID=7830 RepID=UPI0018F35897|nr:cadherin-7-like isoform X2 [Scyliorhinus canicula]
MVNRMSLWLTSVALCVLCYYGTNSTQESLQNQKWNMEQSKAGLVTHRRVKRGWVWNQFFIVEEYTGTEPLYVGKIHSDSDKGDGAIKYTISGEGAGTVFIIDQITGDIHATERLDREEKTYYTLRAQARDRLTDRPLEPESEFIIKVQDINDSEPKFLDGPYVGSVPELSPVGTSVMQVTASDADDPTYGSSARLLYTLVEEQDQFTVDLKTGIIRTAVANLDRERKDHYVLVIQAKDMAGQLGGLSGSTTVTITITDINDNPPRFNQKLYQLSMPESAAIGTTVGKVKAEDVDLGQNSEMTYTLKEEDGSDKFSVITDTEAQEGIIILRKPLDFETKRTHSLLLEAVNKHIDPQFENLRSFKDWTSVRVMVKDVNEPPEFISQTNVIDVQEDAHVGSVIGSITARDPDLTNSPIRYSIDRNTDLERIFNVDANTGDITIAKRLDRETAGWHNITVIAMEAENTAGILTHRNGFNRQEQDIYLLPILVVDSGPPALSSTGTLTIRVCGCDSDGTIQSCTATAYVVSAVLSPGALIALLVCILILIVLVLLILTLKRHRKGHMISEDEEDMRDNVIKYNDEGGGEEDTEAYDMTTLRSLYDFTEVKADAENVTPELHSLPQWFQNPDADFSIFRSFVCKKLEEADVDLSVPPYDSFQTYAYEGTGSLAQSLSSINSLSTDSDQDYNYLSDWGPRFRQLAGLYSGNQADDGS